MFLSDFEDAFFLAEAQAYVGGVTAVRRVYGSTWEVYCVATVEKAATAAERGRGRGRRAVPGSRKDEGEDAAEAAPSSARRWRSAARVSRGAPICSRRTQSAGARACGHHVAEEGGARKGRRKRGRRRWVAAVASVFVRCKLLGVVMRGARCRRLEHFWHQKFYPSLLTFLAIRRHCDGGQRPFKGDRRPE